MPTIKPVSDLRNYNEVLRDVEFGAPVYLTKNGRGCYAIVDIKEYEKYLATLQLLSEIEKGRRSGDTKGWIPADEAERRLGVINESSDLL